MTETLLRLRELRLVLQRLGARQAARFWSNDLRVFMSNLLGGTATGAIAFIVAAVILSFDVQRGENSILAHVVHAVQEVVATLRSTFEQGLR